MSVSKQPPKLHFRFHTSGVATAIYYLMILGSILIFALLQPFGDPPDEVARFKIPQFIANYGFLPTGEEFEVAIGGYGGSYAFQPILPYIIQGYLLRILNAMTFFADHMAYQLLAARLVNVSFGLVTAHFVRRIAVLLFSSAWTGWLFSVLVMFLPQHLFLHSYVNTDSMAMLSGSIILYACIRGWKSGWNPSNSLLLGVGLTFCILSYYNAYGFVVMAILFYCCSYIKDRLAGNARSLRAFITTALALMAFVLLTSGWWFLRNALLHNGDFLGLAARSINASRTALDAYNPGLRQTLADQGISLSYMLCSMDFTFLLWQSFVASFGPMTITTLPWLYIWYYRLFRIGWLLCLLPFGIFLPPRETLRIRTLLPKMLFHLCLLTAIVIPVILCVFYSYTSDYQPQGRYIMPMLLPFMYFITAGIHNLGTWITSLPVFKGSRFSSLALPVCCLLPICFMAGALTLTMLKVVIPHYISHPNLWNAPWIPL